ncbi:hypothetical protein C0J52_19088 [Blattella germanica]|nr:hypothetical protein C0J52_19088 [Blattella germanica]PSN34535.1 hypothetical protein C0J52_19088 [Blattella germanica]
MQHITELVRPRTKDKGQRRGWEGAIVPLYYEKDHISIQKRYSYIYSEYLIFSHFLCYLILTHPQAYDAAQAQR